MSAKFFGQYLLEKGRITSQQLVDALEFQKTTRLPIGTLSLERGLLTSDQVKLVLARQLKSDKHFGELAVSLGLLTQAQVDELLQAQSSHKILLGEALIVKGFISVDGLERELREYKKEEDKLNSQLTAAFNAIANKQIVQTFTNLMVMMLTSFGGQQDIKVEQCETGKEKVRLFRWVISQKIAGENVEFNCLLSVPPKLLLQMASTMLDENISMADELALDATKEFVNIANGNACAKLSEDGVALTLYPPEVYETTMKPYPFQKQDVVCVHLASPDSKLEVAFEF
ncbi:MAG: chemotaxis protein CheX [Candidatus Binatia bacterium]